LHKKSTRRIYKKWFLRFPDFCGCETQDTLEWDEIEPEDQMEAFKNHLISERGKLPLTRISYLNS